MDLVVYSLSISLLDSLLTTQQIIIFVLLLSTARPLRNSLSYLAGLIGAYYVCGLAGYTVLDRLLLFLSKCFPSTANMSNPQYYQTEFFMGVIMLAIGIWYFLRNKDGRQSRSENLILLRLQSMTGKFAFYAGVFISLTSFPFSIPYLITLGKYSTLHMGVPAVAGYLIVYNLGYALPMLLVLAIYLFTLRGTADYSDTLHGKAKSLNLHLNTWTFVLFGVFSMVDASFFFTTGHALLKGRYF